MSAERIFESWRKIFGGIDAPVFGLTRTGVLLLSWGLVCLVFTLEVFLRLEFA